MNVLSRKEMATKIGVSVVTLWRLQRSGQFPASIQLSQRRVGLLEQDGDDYLEARRQERQNIKPVAALGG